MNIFAQDANDANMTKSDCNEKAAYVARCHREHAAFAQHLGETRGRRGLFVEFRGLSTWGLGHALWDVFLIHDVCRQLGRYCHIKLYDMDLGSLMGYSFGNLSWAPPDASEIASYRAAGPTMDVKWKYHLWSKNRGASINLLHYLRGSEFHHASYIHVVTPGPIQGADQLRFLFPYNAVIRNMQSPLCPARPSRTQMTSTAPNGTGHKRYCKIIARLTRCFCRFVTEPRFAVDRSSWETTYQLRTGYADISDTVLARIKLGRAKSESAAACAPTVDQLGDDASWQYSEMTRWLLQACQGSSRAITRLAGGFVLTDAPALRGYIIGHSNLCNGTVQRAAGIPWKRPRKGGFRGNGLVATRSWNAPLAAKKMAFADLVIASRSAVVYVGASSFMTPMVMRSVCIERVHQLSHETSPCPTFEKMFDRGLFGVVKGSSILSNFKSRTRPSLPLWHPCKRMNRTSCIAHYVASVVGSSMQSASTSLVRAGVF